MAEMVNDVLVNNTPTASTSTIKVDDDEEANARQTAQKFIDELPLLLEKRIKELNDGIDCKFDEFDKNELTPKNETPTTVIKSVVEVKEEFQSEKHDDTVADTIVNGNIDHAVDDNEQINNKEQKNAGQEEVEEKANATNVTVSEIIINHCEKEKETPIEEEVKKETTVEELEANEKGQNVDVPSPIATIVITESEVEKEVHSEEKQVQDDVENSMKVPNEDVPSEVVPPKESIETDETDEVFQVQHIKPETIEEVDDENESNEQEVISGEQKDDKENDTVQPEILMKCPKESAECLPQCPVVTECSMKVESNNVVEHVIEEPESKSEKEKENIMNDEEKNSEELEEMNEENFKNLKDRKMDFLKKIEEQRLKNEEENAKLRKPVDKFRTIRIHIKPGNTKSLLEKFNQIKE